MFILKNLARKGLTDPLPGSAYLILVLMCSVQGFNLHTFATLKVRWQMETHNHFIMEAAAIETIPPLSILGEMNEIRAVPWPFDKPRWVIIGAISRTESQVWQILILWLGN